MSKLDQAVTLHAERCSIHEISVAMGWAEWQTRRILRKGWPRHLTRVEREAKRMGKLRMPA